MSADQLRAAVALACQELDVSEHRVYRALGVHRFPVRCNRKRADDKAALREDLLKLAHRHRRHGYRRITVRWRRDAWKVNYKRVERLWHELGLQMTRRRGHSQRHDGSCARLRPCRRNHVRSCNIVSGRLRNGGMLRFLTEMDEHSRECLAIRVGRRLTPHDVPEALSDLFLSAGTPEHIRSDDGPEFTSGNLKKWLAELGIQTACIVPGCAWENGFNDGFNGRYRDEFLEEEEFYNLMEAQVLTEEWRRHYNHDRTHSALGYAPPMPLANVRHGDCSAPQSS